MGDLLLLAQVGLLADLLLIVLATLLLAVLVLLRVEDLVNHLLIVLVIRLRAVQVDHHLEVLATLLATPPVGLLLGHPLTLRVFRLLPVRLHILRNLLLRLTAIWLHLPR